MYKLKLKLTHAIFLYAVLYSVILQLVSRVAIVSSPKPTKAIAVWLPT